MKKKYLLILILSVLVFISLALFKERIVFKVAKANIKKTLPQSKFTIKKIAFNPFSHLYLQGVSIKSPLQRYSIYLESVDVHYNLFSLIKGEINKVALNGINVSIEENIKVNPGKPVLIRVKEINASGSAKFREIDIKNFQVVVSEVADTKKSGQINFNGALSVEAVSMKKIKLSAIQARIDATQEKIDIPEFNLTAFGGSIKGDAEAALSSGSGMNFIVKLTGGNVDLQQLNEDFELKDKFEVTGLCDFYLTAKGDSTGLTELDGNLNTHEGGGKFVITDKQSLNKLDLSKDVSFDLALESLKNYQYDKGNAKVYIEDGNIVLHMLMDGESGARDLKFVYHGGLKFNQKFF